VLSPGDRTTVGKVNGVELRHLRYFVAVAEKLNFSEAAKSVHITQPSLSQQIQDLERDMGVELIERTSRQIRLTTAGEAFFTDAQNILFFADKARQKAKLVDNGQIGELRLGFLFPAVHPFMTTLIRQYRELYPNVSLKLGHYEPAELMKRLHDGQLDVVFTRPYNRRLYPDFHAHSIRQDDFVAVLPPDHPLSNQSNLTVAQISQHPLVLFSRELAPDFYDQIIEQCPADGILHTVDSHESYLKAIMLMMVESGMGVGIMPRYVQNLHPSQCQFVPISGVEQKVELLVVRQVSNIPIPVVDSFVKLTLDTALPNQMVGQEWPHNIRIPLPYLPDSLWTETA
jgi:DNA-binding transcriptional LysR family regulator